MIPSAIAHEVARIAGIAMVGVSGIAALTLILCARIFKTSPKERKR